MILQVQFNEDFMKKIPEPEFETRPSDSYLIARAINFLREIFIFLMNHFAPIGSQSSWDQA